MALHAVVSVGHLYRCLHRVRLERRTIPLPFPRRRLMQFVRHCRPENDDLIRRSSDNVINIRPEMLMTGSTAFYGAMTLASIALGNVSGIKVLDSVKSSLDITGSLTWLTPMISSLLITVALTDRVPQLKRIRTILETSFLPSLSQLPPWGPAVLAFGAGIGEEALFRGWLQPFAINSLSGLPGVAPVFFGVLFTSLFFGLCHYVTETYLIWATVFGALFGIESMQIGLPAAMLTHALYDWFAFVFIQEMWKTKNSD